MKSGIELIAQERKEQIEKHGYDSSNDFQYVFGELSIVASILAVYHTDAKVIHPNGLESGKDIWGLESKLKNDNIHRLKVAGALIAAEIDRLQNNETIKSVI